MKALLISIVLFLSSISLFAQTTTTIRGHLVDSLSQDAISYATILLFQEQQPQKPVKVAATDDAGFFKLESVSPGKYILKVEFVGKNSLAVPVSVENNPVVNLGTLQMSDNTQLLNEITVTAQKTLVKVDLDKITYSLEDDPDAKTNNVLEMMKKVPMITVDGEENVQLKGSSNFKYYMNGKPSNMLAKNPKDVLRSIPANTVKNIEVITDPGAKYDAEGVTGIINIVTQSQTSLGGYTVSLNGGGSLVGSKGGYYGGTYFSVKYGKVGLTGNFSYNDRKNPQTDYSTFRENYRSDDNHYLTQKGRMKNNNSFLYGTGELSYEIDTLSLININYNRFGGDYTSETDLNVLMEKLNKENVYEYDRYSNSKGGWSGTTLGADYQRTFNVKQRLLTASYKLDASNDNMDAMSRIYPVVNYYGNANKQFSDADSYEHTFQIDYTTPIAKIHTVETGAKFIKRINQSNSGTAMESAGKQWVDIPSVNDQFKHVQDILSAYAGYSVKYKKMGFKTGLRLEATRLNARFPLDTEQNFKVNYSNLVPSATVTYMLKPGQTTRLGYNLRIQRPGIWYLNPYVNTVDTNYISYGNPELDAVKYHNFSLNYNLYSPKFNANVDLSYNFTNNAVSSLTWIEDRISYTSYFNIANEKRLGLSSYASWTPTTKWRIYANLSGSYSNLRANNGSNIRNSGFNANIYGGVQYTFPHDFIATLNSSSSTPRINLQGKSMGYYFYGLSASKSFLPKKALTIRLSANNLFNKTNKFESTQQTDDFYYQSMNYWYARQFSLSVSYRFGEMKAQIKKVSRSIQNDDAMQGGSNNSSNGGATTQ
ncbi:TonB-dependent receptor [Bacteroidia bacterium]|nr:TonB-dependent receptor [Bacteroidia bacterium]